MTDQDDKLTRRYRELAREEPGAALDAAILAASRGAMARPSAARRWGAPVSIAAVLMLAVGVTLNMQREQPGVEYPETPKSVASEYSSPVPESSEPAPQSVAPETPKRQDAAPAPSSNTAAALERRREGKVVASPAPAKNAMTPEFFAQEKARAVVPAEEKAPAALKKDTGLADIAPQRSPRPFSVPESSPTAPAPAAAAAAAPMAPQAEAVQSRDASEARRAGSLAAPGAAPLRAKREADAASQPALRAQSALDDPAQELERIARLRAEGRHADADKALEEFRRRHPDFRISDAMLERVKRP